MKKMSIMMILNKSGRKTAPPPPADLPNVQKVSRTTNRSLHRACFGYPTYRLARDQRERRERSDTHTREFPLFGENARDIGNRGLVVRCSVWRKESRLGETRSVHGSEHEERLTERDTDVAAVDVVRDCCFVRHKGLLALQGGPVSVVGVATLSGGEGNDRSF